MVISPDPNYSVSVTRTGHPYYMLKFGDGPPEDASRYRTHNPDSLFTANNGQYEQGRSPDINGKEVLVYKGKVLQYEFLLGYNTAKGGSDTINNEWRQVFPDGDPTTFSANMVALAGLFANTNFDSIDQHRQFGDMCHTVFKNSV